VKRKAKILLVDNQADFVETQKAALEGSGYEVITAATGTDGLETVRAEMPDLVILEVMLEEHDTGFEVTRRIKSDPLFQKIPVLMVSSVAQATGYRFSMNEDGYWIKADGYLEKPVSPDVLIEHVEGLLDAHHANPDQD